MIAAADGEVKEYDAPWLEEVDRVLRDAAGRFTSKDGGSSKDEDNKEDEKNADSSGLDDIMTGVDDLFGSVPDILNGLEKQKKQWEKLPPDEKEKGNKKGKEIIERSLGSEEKVKEMGPFIQGVGLMPEGQLKDFEKGVSDFWKESQKIAESQGPNLVNFLQNSLKGILENVRKILPTKSEPTEERKEEQKEAIEKWKAKVAGWTVAAQNAATNCGIQASKSAVISTLAGLGAGGYKAAFLTGISSIAGGEIANLGVQGLLTTMAPEMDEKQKEGLGTITRIATSVIFAGISGRVLNKQRERGDIRQKQKGREKRDKLIKEQARQVEKELRKANVKKEIPKKNFTGILGFIKGFAGGRGNTDNILSIEDLLKLDTNNPQLKNALQQYKNTMSELGPRQKKQGLEDIHRFLQDALGRNLEKIER